MSYPNQLSASRMRIVEAGLSERRRLERKLDDGAQQRLVSLSLQLRLAQRALRDDPERAEAPFAAAGDELELALEGSASSPAAFIPPCWPTAGCAF